METTGRGWTQPVTALATGIGIACALAVPSAHARPPAGAKARAVPAVAQPAYAAALLMDRDTGTVLVEKDAHRQWPPASMVKMMPLLIAIERVRDGSLSLDEPVTASAWASRIGGSQVYLREGETFPLREMLKAIVIASANDATVAVAEHIAGTAEAFVELMNERGRALGLEHSVFHSVHGLPPGTGQQDDLMCAHDLAVLGRELMRHAEIMEWARLKEAPFRDGQFQMTNTNHLVRWYQGATGLKTGYTRAAGFEVTATATRGDLDLVAVVLGAPTKKGCFDEAAKLLTTGFSQYRAIAAGKKGQAVGPSIPVEGGETEGVNAVATADLRFLIRRADDKQVKVEARVPRLVAAPVQKGQPLGEVIVSRGEETLGRVPLVADRDVAATGWLAWWRNRSLASTAVSEETGQ